MIARHIDEWSVVRLPDGRVGALSKRGRKPVVCMVAPDSDGWILGVEVDASDDLEVLAFPAQCAGVWMRDRAYFGTVTSWDGA